MTDAVSLHHAEWQSLCLGSAQQLVNYFASGPALTEDGLKAVEEHIDRMRTFARAWRASSPAPINQAAAVNSSYAQQTNGHAEPPAKPKGKGGWPKGKSRKPRAEVTQ